jgi:hypothetical protein
MRYRRPLAGHSLLALALALGACLPSGASAAPDDAYLAGYVAAVLERQFSVNPRSVQVKDGVVSIDAADVPRPDQSKVTTALSAVPGVVRVELRTGPLQAQPAAPEAPTGATPPPVSTTAAPPTGFLPTDHLFKPLIADPRWPHFSAAYRSYLKSPSAKDVAAVSFGETAPIYRGNMGEDAKWGQWEAGIQAGVFSTFDLDSASFDLINTDFFVAAFTGYRLGDFSALGRLFHQSSHLGDEFLLRASRPTRINLSYEGLDAKLSYDLPLGLRVYGGGGYLFDVDPPDLGRGLAQAGAEFRSPWTLWRGRLRPVAGVDLQWRAENNWNTDLSVRAGLQFENVSLLSRNLQLLVEYYNGHSFEGQFFKDSVEYIGVGLHFNF